MPSPANDLNCKDLVELVTNYLEGALSPADRMRFDEHLSGCPYCRIYLDQMRQTIRALGHLPDESISPQALESLLERFRNWH
jgi:predicted anti-sigma-YlaC factor YlaD